MSFSEIKKSKREKLNWDTQVLYCVLAIDTFFVCAITRCLTQENSLRRWYSYFIVLALLFVTAFLISRVVLRNYPRIKEHSFQLSIGGYLKKNIVNAPKI